MELVTEQAVLEQLERVVNTHGTVKKAATVLGVNKEHLAAVRARRVAVGEKVPAALGYRRVVLYEPR